MSAPARTRGGLVEVDRDAWDSLLARLGLLDPYLARGYVESACLLDPGRPAFLHLEAPGADVVFPAIVREIPEAPGRRDVTTPYGYGGPVAVGDEALARRFYALYERWCAEKGVVTTFLRFHPLLGNRRYAPADLHAERLANTATWPLPAGADLLAGMHSMHRRGCRKALAAGVDVSVDPAPPRLDDFAALYEDSMSRAAADAFYFFPRAYWGALVTRVPERLVRLDARADGELLATMLLLVADTVSSAEASGRGGRRWLHYHLGVTSERGRALGASKLLFLEAARWGQERGFDELHLGSGVGGREDSLWQFKQRFSAHPGREFWIGKLVHDERAYRELSGDAGVDGFFPAYRSPVARPP